MHGKSMLMPAVWGGLAIGILSALPIVGAFNFCCCLWIVTGGVLAAYVLQSNTDVPIEPGDGALVGFLSGLFGAFVYVFVSLPLTIVLGPVQQRAVSRILETIRDIPPELRDALSTARGPEVAVASVVLGLVMMLFLGAIFATAGGLLGAVFFKKKAAPPPSPTTEPPGYLQS
jgi:hypothetical protein